LSDQPEAANFRHVYRLSPGRLFVLPGVWLLFTLVLGGAALGSDKPGDTAAAVFTLLMLSAIVLPLVLVTWLSRLELTAEGITHFQTTYRIKSTWQNLESLTLGPGPEGLILRERGGGGWFLRFSQDMMRAFGMAEGFGGQALAEGRFIALAPFMAHWRRGPLQEDLRRMAPHLFEAPPQAKA
jgi:hypothetical protein